MIYDFLYENLNFLYGNLNFLYENLRFSLRKIWMIFSMIFSTIHKISYYNVRVPCSHHQTTGPFQKSGWVGSGHFSLKTAVWAGSAPIFFATIRVGPDQPQLFLTNASWDGSTQIFLLEKWVEPAQLNLFENFGLSWRISKKFQKIRVEPLNSVFFKNWVEPAQLEIFSDGKKPSKICFLRFFATFGLSRLHSDFWHLGSARSRDGTGWTQKNVKKSVFWGTVRMDSAWLQVVRGGCGVSEKIEVNKWYHVFYSTPTPRVFGVSARPNQSCMFPYRQINFRKVFYLSFSTNT